MLAGPSAAQVDHAEQRLWSALAGGVPARQRVLGAQGRKTVRRLLDAGLAELAERGLHAFRVDDVDVIYAAFHSAQPTGLRNQPAEQPAP